MPTITAEASASVRMLAVVSPDVTPPVRVLVRPLMLLMSETSLAMVIFYGILWIAVGEQWAWPH